MTERKNEHEIANELLDAAMTDHERAYWAAQEAHDPTPARSSAAVERPYSCDACGATMTKGEAARSCICSWCWNA